MPASYIEQPTLLPSLVKSLPSKEAEALKAIFLCYGVGDLESNLLLAIRRVEELANAIRIGYSSLGVEDLVKPEMRTWRKNLQGYIESLVSPMVGRDRQAIALGYFRDFILVPDAASRWVNLVECRGQLVQLYNTVAPNPFEL